MKEYIFTVSLNFYGVGDTPEEAWESAVEEFYAPDGDYSMPEEWEVVGEIED